MSSRVNTLPDGTVYEGVLSLDERVQWLTTAYAAGDIDELDLEIGLENALGATEAGASLFADWLELAKARWAAEARALKAERLLAENAAWLVSRASGVLS